MTTILNKIETLRTKANKTKSVKTYNAYGVEMTSLQIMNFNKYLDNNRISMNTFYKQERTVVAKNWINQLNK
jgi:hypothetical protein